MDQTNQATVAVDVAIAGGGIAGAWLMRLLTNRGYRVALFEGEGWGADQTLASQGMIHGGLKYALSGVLTGASEAIADMPERWRRCVAGLGEVDLSKVHIVNERYYMFAEASALGKLTTLFAAKALRGRISKLPQSEHPAEFSGFNGEIYALNDFVVDTQSLLEVLTGELAHQCWHLTLDKNNVSPLDEGWLIKTPDHAVQAKCLISCAGNGSAKLVDNLGITDFAIQNRPLKQVSVRPKHDTALWAHCLTGIKNNEPRLTITSHREAGELVWYLGGKLATSGVDRSDAEQIAFAKQELATCVPWLDWQGALYQAHYVERAEPRHRGGLKPDQSYAERAGDFIQCFPTKLTLAPDLGDRVLALLPPPEPVANTAVSLQSKHPVPKHSPPWLRGMRANPDRTSNL